MRSLGPFAFDGPVEIIAHRGYSAQAPENTLAAMKLAVRAGADAVEFDVQTASDHTPYLLHDGTLDRTSDGAGLIETWSPDRLAGLDAGSWFSEAFAAEPIPTLAHVLDQMTGRIARVYAEVKSFRSPSDLERIVEIVGDSGIGNQTVFISMDWEALDRVRQIDTGALIGYIVEERSRATEGISRAQGDPRALLDFNAEVLLDDPHLAERSRAADIRLVTWTVNTVEQADELRKLGVSGITTNEVDTLRAWKERL